jgi:hypothetical protein
VRTFGQRITEAVNAFGIGGDIVAIEGSATERTVRVRTLIYGTDGRPVLNETGDDAATALWEIPMTAIRP